MRGGEGAGSGSLRLWHAADLGGVDLLSAEASCHAYERHVHEGYALGVVAAGGHAFTAHGETWRAGPGHVVLVNPDVVHDGGPHGAAGYTYRMFYVAESQFAAAIAEVTGERPVSPFFACPAIEDPQLAARIWHLHRVLEGSPGRLAREAALFEVLMRLGLRYAAERPRHAGYALHRGIAKRAAAYLEGNIACDVSLSELAEAVGVSRFHLLRVFRRETGLPPHAWLMQRRLALAKQRLHRGEPPASVAASLGFADQSHLNRRFRGAFGVTPGQYQRRSNRRQS